MTVDMGRYVKLRMTDPGFTAWDAMEEYFTSHLEDAVDLAFENSSDAPFDDEILEMEINSMDGCDAF